jgi:DNA-binding transcriptional MerR regulator
MPEATTTGEAAAPRSIGEVLSVLQEEFPDVTISKIRFLEGQGLVRPERNASGYRQFSEQDVEQLIWILRLQRDRFLPLKVIKRALDRGIDVPDAGDGSQPTLWSAVADEAVASEAARARAAESAEDPGSTDDGELAEDAELAAQGGDDGDGDIDRGTAGGGVDGGDGADRRAGGDGPAGGSPAAAGSRPADAQVAVTPSGATSAATGGTSGTGSAPAGGEGARSAPPPTTATAATASGGPTVAVGPTAPTPGRAAAPAPARGGASPARTSSWREPHPRRSSGGTASGGAASGGTASGSGSPGGPGAPGGPVPGGKGSGGSAPAAGTPTGARSSGGQPPKARHRTPADVVAALQEGPTGATGPRGRSGPRRGGPEPTAAAEAGAAEHPGTGPDTGGAGAGRAAAEATPSRSATAAASEDVHLDRHELLAASGLSEALLEGLEQYGLIEPGVVGGEKSYDGLALRLATAAARYAELGLEPRHLRAHKVAAEREAGLVEQVVMPLLKQRNPAARARAAEIAAELVELGAEMHALVLARELGPGLAP